MKLDHCHNFSDFRKLAKRRLPAPIFHYIDGAADDEVTYRRNTEAYDSVDLVPNVLQGTDDIDMSVEVMGQKLAMPLYCTYCIAAVISSRGRARCCKSGDAIWHHVWCLIARHGCG